MLGCLLSESQSITNKPGCGTGNLYPTSERLQTGTTCITCKIEIRQDIKISCHMLNNPTVVYLSKGNLFSVLRRYLHSCICYSAIYKNQGVHSLVKEGMHVIYTILPWCACAYIYLNPTWTYIPYTHRYILYMPSIYSIHMCTVYINGAYCSDIKRTKSLHLGLHNRIYKSSF